MLSPRVCLLLFSMNGLLAVYLAFFALDPLEQQTWLMHTLIYPLLLGCTVFVLSLITLLRGTGQALTLQPKQLVVALVILLAWLFLISREPHQFKILQDEYVLSAVAMNLHYRRSAAVPDRGYWVENGYSIADGYLDKRPLLFPLLLATTHDILSYDINNVFLLNTIITLLVLVLSYLLARQLGSGSGAALLVVIGIASVPLVAQNAAGAGFELLNSLMLLLTLLLGIRFARQPDPLSLTALCYATFLLAQTRYESSLFVLCTAALVLWVWRREQRVILSLPVVILPLLFILPTLALQAVVLDPFWMQLENQQTAFSLALIFEHLQAAAEYFFAWGKSNSMNPVTGLLAAAALFLYLVRSARQRLPVAHSVLLIFLAGVLINFSLLMSYHWGDIRDYNSSRLALPLILLALVCLAVIGDYRRWLLKPLTILLLIGIVIFTVPRTTRHAYSTALLAPVEDAWAVSTLLTLNEQRNILVITKDTPFFILNKISAISTNRAIESPTNVAYLLITKLFKPYAYQKFTIDPQDKSVHFISRFDLHEQFQLNPLKTRNSGAYSYTQLSEIVKVLPASPRKTALDYPEYKLEQLTGVISTFQLPLDAQRAWWQQLP